MNIYSLRTIKASNEEDDKPNADILAAYVESLKLYARSNPTIDGKIKSAIDALPSPTQIKSNMSDEEGKLLYETVDWAWKKITGHDIVQELKVTKAPEHLMGNYWILRNGVILSGENHFTIIKNNLNMFSSLLNVGANTLLGHMGSEPNKVIECAIANGAMRVYVNNNKEFFSQMSSDTYGEWGRTKVRRLDFKDKVVKVIDLSQPYKGWSSGVAVRL